MLTSFADCAHVVNMTANSTPDMSAEEVINRLRTEILAEGGVVAWARKHKVNQACVSLMAQGHRGPQPVVLRAMGVEAVTVYRVLPK